MTDAPGRPASRLVSPHAVADALGLHPPTDEQAAVIGAPAEPALVVAGAGAGKTETMAARVVWLVANGIVTPDRVLGLTFTRKAARQLADRVRARLRRLAGSGLLDRLDPSGDRAAAVLAGEPTVLTYHAYAGRLVSEHGLRIPVEPGARLLTETASWQLAHRVVSGWTEDIETDKVPTTITAHVLALAGELAEHLVTPADLQRHEAELRRLVEAAPRAKGQRAQLPTKLLDVLAAQRLRVALLPLVAEYGIAKRREGAMDFADQMSLAAELASKHPEVVVGERERYGAVLLDEYQDTGHAQRILLRSLFGGVENAPMPVTSVGDPAQAIYGWRGASAANLPRFETDFPRSGTSDSSPRSGTSGSSPRSGTSGSSPRSGTSDSSPRSGTSDSSPRSGTSDGVAGAARLLPARRYGLLTSFRNPPQLLTVANALSAPLRASGVAVDELRARAGAADADVRCALLPDVRSELNWLADRVADAWHAELDASGTPPTSAVLVRRRADMADIAAALRERGLPVEVVGLGGLLDEPEVRDLVSALRMLVDPLAGTAAMRLLTGARWRLGAADIAALWRRAGQLAVTSGRSGAPDDSLAAIADAIPGEHAEQAGLVDAVDDPGDPAQYSAQGYRRIRGLGRELAALRRRLEQPLPELVADVERTLLLDIETLARPGVVGRAQLDAFADVVTDFAAASPSATLPVLLDYLSSAERAEDGLEPGEVEVAADRVQVLTVHAAKGLEWQVVAVPNLVGNVFPAAKKSSSWLRSVTELPAELRGDAPDLPVLHLASCGDRKEVLEALEFHEDEFDERRLTEELRLLYVALTRSERMLLASGHWWGETGTRPRGPSPFLRGVHRVLTEEHPDSPPGLVDCWAPEPAEDEVNPLAEHTRTSLWPVDPLGGRRSAVEEGAALVRRELAAMDTEDGLGTGNTADSPATDPAEPGAADDPPEADDPDDPDGWARDVDVLLAERSAASARREQVLLPATVSVSQLVDLAADREELARRLRRPLPYPPNPVARRGTAFHTWLEQRFAGGQLFDFDELPGFADADAAPDTALAELQEAFLAGAWADRIPHRVEVPFEMEVEGVAVRGRMDAVFTEPDGSWIVVDWKTGAVPDGDHLRAVSVQLAAYRLAWSGLTGVPVDKVRAAFHYVRSNRTVRPADLLDADGLRGLLRTIPAAH